MSYVLILTLSELAITQYLAPLRKKFNLEILEAGDPVTTQVQGDEFPQAILYFSGFSEDYEKNLRALRVTYPSVPLVVIHDLNSRIRRRDIVEKFSDALVEKPVPGFIVDILEAQIRKGLHSVVKASASPSQQFNEPQPLSEQMQKVLRIARKVAPTDATILLTGESGTGKEVTANLIHQESLRKARPFVAINCGAITETILESELFGHKKGAFTGADRDKTGLFEAADSGTLFLDEIGEMPFSLQVKLLRVLQERKIRRVGDVEDIPVNVRIIAATNKDLRKLVALEKFREDLYYRLNVIHLHLPPLRERKESLPSLIHNFVTHYSQKYQKRILAISPACENILMNYNFPGNIRELQNIIEHAVIMNETASLLPQDLPVEMQKDSPMNLLPAPKVDQPVQLPASLHQYLEQFYSLTNPDLNEIEKVVIQEKLSIFDGNQKQVAESLGISRTSLWRKLKDYRLE